ncbi:streptococcal pilin isopeptide linkage domain-containing protein [Streptococcus sp. F0442]|uniref:SpaA isopeptide-forming pilin-related protein n=1 Tax=Streptococcus sp. F0442 TaxID=999425 RepID=UPI0002993EFE|nr:SpaA isopeptide-forming pilin-related protein [Streptococcus sp. F0442]EKS17977.1 streptococcal pilin isopeptide linkage domain-containing protein [Streptococcus sp. F0442]
MKKLAIYLLMMLSLLIVCFTLFSKKVNAETSKKVDVITDVKVQNNDGGDLTAPLGRYDTFRLNAKFALEGKNVKAGDTTEVVIASPIDIKSQDFEINDSITGKLIANAKVDATTGKIVLTFTKFVEEKNDISGSFFFYAGVNKDKFPNDGNAPVKVSVNNKVKFDGTVKSGTVGEGKRYTIIKSGWDNGDHKSLGFRISVNRTNEAISNAVLSDSMESPGVTYKAGSFKIYKGTWDYSTGTWQLKNKTDVTSQYTVNATDTTFTINLGNISANDHFAVEYEAVVNYDAVDREVIKNKATIVGDNKKPYDSNSKVNIQIAGGEGVGYAFGIQVHKVDESNGPLKGAKFQVIRQATGQVLGEFESDAKGEFSLKELLRDKYIIKEIQAPEGYELAEDTIVEASEFTTPTKPVSKTIINKKEKPAKTQAVIELDKVLTGRDLVDGEFSFELYEGANKLQTTTNQSGKITFEPIEFTAEGEHTYTVKEVKGDNATITYDASEKQVTIKVTRVANALQAEVVYPESKTFTNAFTPKAANATIELDKKLTGRDLVDGEFSFELYEGTNKLQTVTNKAGKVSFDAISYTAEGEHTYTVKEVKGDNATITYDASEKQVTVKVTRNGEALKAEVIYPESKTFTNAFTPNATTATIELDKELTGRDLVDGEFSFELYEGANKLQTVTNKSGKVSFDAIPYTAEGEHTYTVKEVKGTTPGITYDTSEKQVTVKVTKDGNNLKATVVYPESKVFTNTYSAPSPAKAQISASKILEGRALKDGEFSFTLLDEAGKVLQTKQNAADGSVAFDEISYSQEDAGKTFHYTIKEVIPTTQEKGMTYDQASIEVTVTVTKDEASNTINATVAYGEKKSFINTFVTSEIPPTPPTVDKPEAKLYTIQLHKVNGEGQALAGAVFGLFEADGTTPVANPYGEGQATATSDASGLVSFVGFAAKDYVVKELTAPEGYQLSTASITVSEAELTASADLAVDKGNVVNKPYTSIPPTPPTVDKPELKLYSIQLHKVNNEGKPLVGAIFGLFEADSTTPVANPYGEGQATATSDANGLVTFTGFEAKDYVVRELTAPEGYQLSTDVIKVSASELKAATNLVVDKGTVVNKPFTSIPPTPPTVDKPELKLYSIQLHKVNNEGKPLVGAVFGLFEADGTTPVANPYGEGQATATSDANGLVTFTGLVAKDYVVKEITAPEGYQLSEEAITVSASQLIASTDQVLDQGKVVNKPFTAIPPTPPTVDKPELKLYNIQLHKVNKEGKALAGAVFGLFEADGTTPVANPYGEGQATATSDANGLVIFKGFEARDYVIKELTAPTGYQLLTNPITVTAEDYVQATDLVVDKGNVVNELTPPTPPTPPTTPPTPPTTPSTDKPKGDKPSGSQPKEEKKHTLPSTGETVSEGLVAAGLALAVTGSALVYKKREN